MARNVKPEQASSVKQQAWKLLSTGQVEAASRIGTELYESGFADGELTYLVGCCQAKLNAFSKAIEYFKESLTYQDSRANLAYIYIALGAATNALSEHDKAVKYYEEALRINLSLVEAYLGLGESCMKKGDIDQAEKYYLQASILNANSGQPFYQLGHIEKRRNNGEKALAYFKKAVDLEPSVADYQIWLGDTFLKLGSIEEARKVCAKALMLSPSSEVALGGLSAAYARLGDYLEAIEIIDRALEADFLIADVAVAFLTVGKHVNRRDEAIDYAKRCLALKNISVGARRKLDAQLALALDSSGRYDEAWHYISECKRYKYSLEDEYDPVAFKVAVDNIISAFTPINLLGVPSSTEKHDYAPIFIVGMPRSGTSLVEQILAVHPDVTACGELRILNDIINEFPALVRSKKDWPFAISDMTQEQVNYLSREYIKRVPDLERQTVFITDKMPHNFFALGLIQLLFPNAKIIHCRRQPLDTCISIYLANFEVGHEYSGNLFNIGAHYHQYLRLMEHWRACLSIELLELDYELLVSNPEMSIRGMLEYCGLTWNENCLHPDKLNRKVKTASFDQVRQPIHTESVNRWRHYEKYLDSLKKGLERGY